MSQTKDNVSDSTFFQEIELIFDKWLIEYWDEGLGLIRGEFPQSCPQTTGDNYGLHFISDFLSVPELPASGLQVPFSGLSIVAHQFTADIGNIRGLTTNV